MPSRSAMTTPFNRRLYAARKGQRRHGRGGEIKRDGNEVGDRNH